MDAQNPEFRGDRGGKAATGAMAWRGARGTPSLADMFATVGTPKGGSFWRKLLAFLGPGYLVAVGYMDPGNWATSLAGGSKFGYALLTVALPRFVSALDFAATLAVGGNRDHRDRSCRSHRHRHRP
jgi:manganese transport protein